MLDEAVKIPHVAHLLIMGDFNCPKINYTSGCMDNGASVFEYNFFDKTQNLFLVQNIFSQTRYRHGDVPSRLDYVFTDEEGLINDVDYMSPLSKSDHVILHWHTIVEPHESLPNRPQKFVFHDYSPVKLQLSQVNWSEMFDGKDVNTCWTLHDMIQKCVPLASPPGDKKNINNGRHLRRRIVRMIKSRTRTKIIIESDR